MVVIEYRALLTIHDHFHIVHQTVDNLQDVSLHHAGFVLSEPVQSAQYILDLAVPQYPLCELLCKQVHESQPTKAVGDHSLSRPFLTCFFAWPRMESNHNLCDYLRHQGAQRDLGIDLEAF